MKGKLAGRIVTSCLALCCLFGGNALCACAYTADDVAAKARASGWPEYLIQAGYNEWSSGEYSQTDLDQAYNSVEQYTEKSGKMIANSLGVRYTEPDPAAATESTQSTSGSAAPSTVTVTKTDGTTEERIDKSEFIQMPLEEKQAYVASLDEASQAAFMESLTPEEKRSIIKQLPDEDKLSLVQDYVDTAKDMGMNVAVDSISGNDISMTIRDSSGTVIGKTNVGTVIDETGISHTAPLLGSFAAVLLALTGIGILNRKSSKV